VRRTRASRGTPVAPCVAVRTSDHFIRSFMQQSVLRVLARIVLATIALEAVVDAQSFQGGVRGTLKDAQGIIPGATIVLLNPANGSSRELLIADC